MITPRLHLFLSFCFSFLLITFIFFSRCAFVAAEFNVDRDDAPNDFVDAERPSNAERDQITARFLQWVRERLPAAQWERRKWEIKSIPGAGYGLVATSAIQKRESIVKIPLRMLLCYLIVCRGPASKEGRTPVPLCNRLLHPITNDVSSPDSMYRRMLRRESWLGSTFLLSESQSVNTALILMLIKFCRSCRNSSDFTHVVSAWSAYVEQLEVDVSVPICSFRSADLVNSSSLSTQIRQHRRLIAEQFDYVKQILAKSGDDDDTYDLFAEEWLKLPNFFWAVCHVQSRSFSVLNKGLDAAMLPVVDLMNHDSLISREFVIDSPEGKPLESFVDVSIPDSAAESGQELRFSYFNTKNLVPHLFVRYGMLESRNPCAVVNLGIEASMPPQFVDVVKAKKGIERASESVFGCFRSSAEGDDGDLSCFSHSQNALKFFLTKLKEQLESTETCVSNVPAEQNNDADKNRNRGLIWMFCDQQERLLLRLIVRVQGLMIASSSSSDDRNENTLDL